MRKGLIILIITIGLLIFFIRPTSSYFNVRVIANSNSHEDLYTKQKIVNIVNDYIEVIFENDSDINLINKNINKLIQDIKEVEATFIIKFDGYTLHNNSYNNYIAHMNSKNTLLILLGEANGSNWWVTVYPEFVGVNEDVELKSLIRRFINFIRGI